MIMSNIISSKVICHHDCKLLTINCYIVFVFMKKISWRIIYICSCSIFRFRRCVGKTFNFVSFNALPFIELIFLFTFVPFLPFFHCRNKKEQDEYDFTPETCYIYKGKEYGFQKIAIQHWDNH